MGKSFSRQMFLYFHPESDGWSPQVSDLPDPKASKSVILPPEILDKVLEHIPTREFGLSTLIVCALVATWWVGPSQRRLFSSVRIHQGNRERWMNGVVLSGSMGHLLQYVRSLRHARGLGYRTRNLAQECGEYLSALHNLESLTLYGIGVEHISEDQFRICYSAFRETLTCLFLEIFITPFSAFVTLVDYFPNITTLRLCLLDLELDEGPVPPLSRPLRGKAHVGYASCFESGFREFCDRFAELDLEYEELVIEAPGSTLRGTAFLGTALKISASTVKFLRLTTDRQSG